MAVFGFVNDSCCPWLREIQGRFRGCCCSKCPPMLLMIWEGYKPVLDWYDIFLDTIWYLCRGFHKFLSQQDMDIWQYFCFAYHSCLYTVQESSHLGKTGDMSIWSRNGLDPNSNSGIPRFSHIDIPTTYQYLIGITILIPTGRFLDTIIGGDHWSHAFTCTLDQHWFFSVFWTQYHTCLSGLTYSNEILDGNLPHVVISLAETHMDITMFRNSKMCRTRLPSASILTWHYPLRLWRYGDELLQELWTSLTPNTQFQSLHLGLYLFTMVYFFSIKVSWAKQT